MTPWEHQTLLLLDTDGEAFFQSKELEPGKWYEIPAEALPAKFYAAVPEVHSPARKLGSSDSRRLAVAFRPADAFEIN